MGKADQKGTRPTEISGEKFIPPAGRSTAVRRGLLSKKIKVHVNITHPADWSFRSARLIDNFPIAPDVLMHDHRKISFYDVTELDPGKGEAIQGGLGIGEHYSGPTWEDRAILMKGPALLTLKDAARRVLLQQGLKEDEIPTPLRPLPKAPLYEKMVNDLVQKGWDATLMGIHNETGFRSKPINAVKATLYSLMPSGSTIMQIAAGLVASLAVKKTMAGFDQVLPPSGE